MTLNREHTLELLALLAVIALVQWPPMHEPEDFESSPTAVMVEMKSTSKSAPMADPDPSHRFDPIALLQASVPDDWRVRVPPYASTASAPLRC